MDEVERFEEGHDGLYRKEDGDFMLYEDFQKLEAYLERLKAKARPLLESFAYGRTVDDEDSARTAREILNDII